MTTRRHGTRRRLSWLRPRSRAVRAGGPASLGAVCLAVLVVIAVVLVTTTIVGALIRGVIGFVLSS